MISIVIPSYKAEKYIARAIKSLLNQDYKGKYEIIIVDSGKDKTAEIASEFPVRIFKQPPKGPGAARNYGVRKAKGDIIVFIDADCFVPRSWLRKLVKPFSDKNIAAVGGTYKNANKDKVVAKFLQYEIEERHEKMKKFKQIDFVGTFNCAYRKDVFNKMGGFKEELIQAEDIDLSYRVSAKHKVVFNSSAYIYHYHVGSLGRYLKQKFQRGYWKVFLLTRHKGKMKGDVYTSKLLGIQVFLTMLFLLGLVAYPVFMFDFTYLLIILLLIYLANYTYFRFIIRVDRSMILPSIPLILLRNIFALAGLVYGQLTLLKRKIT